jgi:hypothetical protein
MLMRFVVDAATTPMATLDRRLATAAASEGVTAVVANGKQLSYQSITTLPELPLFIASKPSM